jgi:hypothetical protein
MCQNINWKIREAKLPPTHRDLKMKIDPVPASSLGLSEIDKLAERQEAFVLLRGLNTAFGRAARPFHTFSSSLPEGAIFRGKDHHPGLGTPDIFT